MRHLTVILATLFVTAVAANPSHSLNLSEPAAKKAVDCQKAINQAVTKFLTTKLLGLDKCATKVSACIQTKSGQGQRDCVEKNRETCAKQLGEAIPAAEAKLAQQIAAKCTPLTLTDVVGDAGLGFDQVAEQCLAEATSPSGNTTSFADLDTIVACIVRQGNRAAERLFAVAEPRARELIGLTAFLPLLFGVLPDLPDYGGGGDGLDDPTGLGKTTQQCVSQLTKSGAGLAKGGLAQVHACTNALFTCEQREPNKKTPKLDACRAKAAAKCGKLAAKLASQRAASRDKTSGKCPVSAYSALRRPEGANLDALQCECEARVGSEELETFGDYQRCFGRQHECRTAELVRLAMPRATELLAQVGMNLEDFLCESAPNVLTLRERSVSPLSTGGSLGARRFVNIRKAFFSSPFGPLTKTVSYQPVEKGACRA